MNSTDFTGIFDPEKGFLSFTGYEDLCTSIVSFSEKARREGLLALEDDIGRLGNSLMEKILQLVIDGTDPELVKDIGEKMIERTIHTLEEILFCVEFAILRGDADDFDTVYALYLKSRDLGNYADIAADIPRQMKEAVDGGAVLQEASEHYRSIIELLGQDIDHELKHEITAGHMDTIARRNDVFDRMILTGILAIQCGDNPRIVLDKLAAMAPVGRDTIEQAVGFSDGCNPLEMGVVAGEVLATLNRTTGKYIINDSLRINLSDGRIDDVAMGLEPGLNTEMSGENLIASINGDVIAAKGKLSVLPLYIVDGDVGPDTGNIVFLGSVFIRGNVIKDYAVKAAGNVYVLGVIEEGAVVEAESGGVQPD